VFEEHKPGRCLLDTASLRGRSGTAMEKVKWRRSWNKLEINWRKWWRKIVNYFSSIKTYIKL
jgi:hypothetical protein